MIAPRRVAVENDDPPLILAEGRRARGLVTSVHAAAGRVDRAQSPMQRPFAPAPGDVPEIAAGADQSREGWNSVVLDDRPPSK